MVPDPMKRTREREAEESPSDEKDRVQRCGSDTLRRWEKTGDPTKTTRGAEVTRQEDTKQESSERDEAGEQ